MLVQLKQGNKESLKIMYELHFSKTYNVAISYTRDKELAEDIVQEVFVKLWKNRDKIVEHLPIEQQLFVITKNLIYDHFRRKLLEESVLLKYKDLLVEPEIDEKEIKEFRLKKVKLWIEKLPKKQQLVFRMHRFQGLTYDEIAYSLNISVNTVSSHISSSMRYLKKNVE